MELLIEKVEGYTAKEIPPESETIEDAWDIDMMLPNIDGVHVYLRDAKTCPFGRGNWIIDIKFLDGKTLCLRLPKEMTEEHIRNYVKPLTDKFEMKLKSRLN